MVIEISSALEWFNHFYVEQNTTYSTLKAEPATDNVILTGNIYFRDVYVYDSFFTGTVPYFTI